MKVMSDHSRIITTNNFSATLPSGSVSLSPPPPSLSVKSCTDAMAEIKIESIADEVTDEKIETKNIEHMEDLLQPKVEDIEVDCSLILPHQSDLKAVLRLPGGFNIHLDRSLFKDVESSQAFKNIYSGKNVKTTIVPRDRSLSFRTGGRNKVLSRSKSQMKPMMENPLTIAQLMDTMIPKKLNSILPKVDLAPGGEVLSSSSGGCQEDALVGGLPGGSERKGDSRMERSKNFVSLPVSVLERNASIEEQAVSLHLPEVPMADISRPIMITTSTPSGHRLPSLVTQLPSTLVSPSHLPSLTLSPTNTLATVSSVPPLRSHSSLPIRSSVSLQKPSIQPLSTVPSTMIPVPVVAPGITHSPGPRHSPDVSLSQILTPVHSQAFTHNLVPATINQASDVNNDSAQLILNDDERQLELNKNVLRCRNYRDRKKNMMRQGEEERFFLTTRNSRLKGKEARLLNATTKLKMFLLRMIRENRYKCCGQTARV